MLRTAGWQQARASRGFLLASGAFTLSGFSALVCQTAWQRMLGLFAGSEAIATTLIVGAFLFGLGLGSLIGGWLADRLSRRGALLGFAFAEIGVGAFAFASPWVLYGLVFGRLEPVAATLAGTALVSFAALALPTVLMGMSLPFLARALVPEVEDLPRLIGILYGVNTAGAGLGCLVGGFLLIGSLGYDGSVYVAGSLDLAAALVAVLLSSTVDPTAPCQRGRSAGGASGEWAFVLRWMLLVFVSGFLAISLEILWFRLLGALMRANAYDFALILGVFLLADALGIFLGAWLARRVLDPERLFLWLQGMVGVYALAAVAALYLAHAWFGLDAFFIDGPSYGSLHREILRMGLYGVLAGVVAAPPALVLGVTFPIVQKAVQRRASQIGWQLGLVQLSNIAGNTAGAVVTGLALLSLVGTSGVLRCLGVVALLCLLGCLGRQRPVRALAPPLPRLGRPATVLLALPLLLLVLLLPGDHALWARLHGAAAGSGAIVREDATGVAVFRPNPNGTYTLFVNGAFQTVSRPRTPLLEHEPVSEALGFIGPLVHRHARSVMLIGYGGGNTLIGTGVDPATRHIRVVEIARPVIEAVRALGRRTGIPAATLPFRDPRIERVIADGRHALFTDPQRYDIIIAETIVPRTAGSNLLFSRAFFEEMRKRLRPGGLAVQWAASPRTVATFRSVFPYVIRLNTVLLGSRRPIPFDRARIEAAIEGWARAAIRRSGVDPAALIRFLARGRQDRWTPDLAPPEMAINTDLHPRDEFYLSNY